MKPTAVKILLISGIFLVIVSGTKLNSIPAFARKYQISCQVCHSPAPHLKPFGEEFAANGYRLTEYESPRYYIQAGDDKLSLLREVPFAIRIDGIATYNSGLSKTIDFATLSGVKLLSGGELSDKLSYYMYFFMSEDGNIVGLEDAFLTYSNLFNSGINISAGQFQVCDPFYKRELRLTLEDIAVLKAVPGQSTATLTYDRGLMADYSIPRLNTDVVLGVVNGNGLSAASEEFLFDKDTYKNVYGMINQPLGKVINLGLMGYVAKERNNTLTGTVYYNNVRILGPVLKLDFDQHLLIHVQYISRMDSWVYDQSAAVFSEDVATKGAYLEAIYAPKGDLSRSYFTGLLNWVDSDFSSLDYKSATLNFSYLLRRNVRLLSELTWLQGDQRYIKTSIGFVAAF